jgi:hypothetical protein
MDTGRPISFTSSRQANDRLFNHSVHLSSNATDDPEIKEITTMDHPHACLNGYIHLGYTAVDKETSEEVEWVEALLCRRCASEAGR